MVTTAADDAFNHAARFLPADPEDPTRLPCIEVAGVQVYAYIRDGVLRVSVHLDTTDEALLRPDNTVATRVIVGDRTVFEG